MKISVLAIGSEILDGRVVDTNSQFISSQLTDLGMQLHRTVVCDDVEKEIIESLTFLGGHSEFIIVTGGLGPTTDDLTREAIAYFTQRPLIHNPEALARLKLRFAERKRVFDPLNSKQANFPQTSSIIPNPVGSAEGFIVSHKHLTIASVPGVPKEMQPMFVEHILPLIKKQAQSTAIVRRGFRVFGLPEATVGRKIEGLSLNKGITVSYRATFPEIHIVLKGTNSLITEDACKRAIEAVGRDFVFTKETNNSLVDEVLLRLKETNASVATAESCTGGMLGMLLTASPGSSAAVGGGFVTYSNDLKSKLLNVHASTLQSFGAVSSETACEMAEGCRKKAETTYALSITGIAGPDGGTAEKPVGTFYVGIAHAAGVAAYRHFFPSDRAAVRRYASYVALDTLRRSLLGIEQYDYAQQKPI